MKVKIVSIECGLGNQMFQYAFYLSLKQHLDNCVYYLVAPNISHNGYELEKVFNIKNSKPKNLFIRAFKKILKRKIDKKYETNFGNYDPEFIFSNKVIAYYCGYWQTERYFQNIIDEVKKSFRFKDPKISIKNKLFLDKIKSFDSVSIHVRRGDYESHEGSKKLLGGMCNLDYYKRAIEEINKYTSNKPYFVVFSDDILWAKNNLKLSSSIYVDWNTGENSWQDMFLMTKCKHNIIANSTFSWWGAWLNSNPNQKVIYPQRWYNKLETRDIAPENWIKI